ncbi:MAG: hypothetical protein ACI30J_00105 [Paludibacteraceae bacterium]
MAEKDGLQRFVFKFSTESEIINRVFAVIYCKRQPIMTAEDLANSNFITNYFTPTSRERARPPAVWSICDFVAPTGRGVTEQPREVAGACRTLPYYGAA